MVGEIPILDKNVHTNKKGFPRGISSKTRGHAQDMGGVQVQKKSLVHIVKTSLPNEFETILGYFLRSKIKYMTFFLPFGVQRWVSLSLLGVVDLFLLGFEEMR